MQQHTKLNKPDQPTPIRTDANIATVLPNCPVRPSISLPTAPFHPQWGQSSSKQAADETAAEEWNSTSTLKRKHARTGPFEEERGQGPWSSPSPTPPIVNSLGSGSSIEFREGDRYPISVEFDLESSEDCLRVSNRILRSLLVVIGNPTSKRTTSPLDSGTPRSTTNSSPCSPNACKPRMPSKPYSRTSTLMAHPRTERKAVSTANILDSQDITTSSIGLC